MLKNFKFQLQLTIIMVLSRFFKQEQLLDIVFCQEGASQNSHYFIDAPIEFKLLSKNSNSTICDNSYIDLYPDGILSISPEGLDAQMTFHPFKEVMQSFT